MNEILNWLFFLAWGSLAFYWGFCKGQSFELKKRLRFLERLEEENRQLEIQLEICGRHQPEPED